MEQDPILERALNLLMVKGSEGDGALHLTCEETHALAEHVRRLSKPQNVNVTLQIDGREIAKHVIPHLSHLSRNF